MELRQGCDGLPAIIVFSAATLAYPCAWSVRAWGLLAGFALIQLLNVIRVVSLFWIRTYKPEWFGQAHVAVWQCVMVLAVLLLWSAWEYRWAAPRNTAPARPR